ncbi:hypothetical protein QLQ77_gp58 [Gordonia phage Reyja]|uniref:Uncharacterized protein n=1 Tax=Gordonia phage Reyja TaxID=2571250 RepID=A0A4D6T849_9CAUD|nr:hypothetical protein QLQ77_gp58 [Gordonia phage Reyja]QCG77803.1 hypothetical protein SEA_REYJA_58 [Gordonia phage Reyja]
MTNDACPTCGQPRRPARRKPTTRTPATNSAFTPSKCRRCTRPTVKGRADALDIVLEATPLTEIGEYAAHAAGRATYTLNHRTGSARWRPEPHIGRPAAEHHTIHTTHQCDAPIPLALSASLVDARKQSDPFPDNPPY